jgi:putative membrane protein
MLQAYAYILYLLSGFLLLAVFFGVYTKITPFNELALIQEGNVAAAFSLGGALIGFSLTLASSVLHSNTYLLFIGWAVGAMIVQAISYAAISRVVPNMNAGIAENNIAMGALMGTTSLTVGNINAACLS